MPPPGKPAPSTAAPSTKSTAPAAAAAKPSPALSGNRCGTRPSPMKPSAPLSQNESKTGKECHPMPFDYKKEYKEFYLPPKTPGIVTVPAMNFLAVRGQGDPNQEGGDYK